MTDINNLKVIPIKTIGNKTNSIKFHNPNGIRKTTAIFLITLLPIAFLGGYLCSRYYQIGFLDNMLNQSESFSSKIQYDLEIQRTTEDIYLNIKNCEFSHDIIFSQYIINERKSIPFNMSSSQDLSILISHDLYEFFNLGINNTNIIRVTMQNSVNLTVSKSAQFSF